MLKPFVLMTVHRRYFEMITNIKRFNILKKEFNCEPSLVIVWADPIKEDEWIFDVLYNNNYVDYIIYRKSLIDDLGMGTTYPESVNINIGLNFIYKKCPKSYCIMQAHDIFIYSGSYHEIDCHMQNNYKAVLFDWVKYGCFATNCFAVIMDKNYWPPISKPLVLDVLERQWWLKLGKSPTNTKIYKDSNHLFWHNHNYGEQIEWLRKHKI